MKLRNRLIQSEMTLCKVMMLFLCFSIAGCVGKNPPDLGRMHHEAEVMVNAGELELAKHYIDSCLQIAPEDAMLHYQKAQCLDMVDEYTELQRELDLAKKYLNKDSCRLRQRIFEHSGHANRYKKFDQKAYDDYLAAYNIAISCPPIESEDSLNNLLNAGYMAAGTNNVLADSIAQVLIDRFPKNISGYSMRAIINYSTGKLQLARLEFDSIIERFQNDDDNNLADSYYLRGITQQNLGDLTAACTDWQKALDLGLEDAKPKLDSFCLKK